MPKTSELEAKFMHWWGLLGDGTPYEREYKFHPTRKWRADFAFLDDRVLVECEGIGGRGRSRHTGITGYSGDCDKYNQAQILGFIVLRFTVLHIDNDTSAMIETVTQALESRRE